jgi:hypothetical protein
MVDTCILYYVNRYYVCLNKISKLRGSKNRMNASDIVQSKQRGTLYKAYYHPIVFQSTNISTLYPISSISTGAGVYTSSFSQSCINTIYTYSCQAPFISYQLAEDVESGKYVCGGKTLSQMNWIANSTMGTSPNYAANNSTLSSSVNQFAVRPNVCSEWTVIQGTNFQHTCEICNQISAGIHGSCHSCVSGT